PHPDDETFGMGGALALAVEQCIDVHVLVLTDGAQGGDSEPDLVLRRQQEVSQALKILGATNLTFFDEPDRGLQPSARIIAKVASIIDELRICTVFFPSPFEPHPDHRATTVIGWEAVRNAKIRPLAVAYEVSVQGVVNLLVDTTSVQDKKK